MMFFFEDNEAWTIEGVREIIHRFDGTVIWDKCDTYGEIRRINSLKQLCYMDHDEYDALYNEFYGEMAARTEMEKHDVRLCHEEIIFALFAGSTCAPDDAEKESV